MWRTGPCDLIVYLDLNIRIVVFTSFKTRNNDSKKLPKAVKKGQNLNFKVNFSISNKHFVLTSNFETLNFLKMMPNFWRLVTLLIMSKRARIWILKSIFNVKKPFFDDFYFWNILCFEIFDGYSHLFTKYNNFLWLHGFFIFLTKIYLILYPFLPKQINET